jgi:hypothetical protein
MRDGMIEIGERPVRMFSRAEYDALGQQVRSLGLPEDDPYLRYLCGMTLAKLDHLFNGPVN